MPNDKMYNEDRARQIHKFEGLGQMRNIVPTDIDFFGSIGLFTEYNGRLFIIGEGKYMNNEMTPAQEKAFQLLCNAIADAKNYRMWVLIYRHEVHDIDEPVYVKDQYVTKVYSSILQEWKEPSHPEIIPQFKLIDGKITMRDALKQIENYCLTNCNFNI